MPDGCTDLTACNYDSTATCDDGSCVLPDGCTDNLACNYDSTATCDDGSCVYPTSSTTIETACDSYSWNGSTYTQSGIYSYVISLNSSGIVSTLSYCSSNPNLNISAGYSIIEDVQLVGDNFNIDNSTSGINDFYEDYTATMYADITEGQTYTVEVITNDLSSASGTYAPEAINVYIDFNIDGDFDDLGEDLGEISIPYGTWISGTVYSFNVTVPSTGVYGATRMRVVTMSNAGGGVTMGPCESPTGFNTPWFGATEDYSIVLNSPIVLCDSTAILDLTINNSTSSYFSVTDCDSFTWSVNNVTYSTSGLYIDSSLNINGCTHIDSLDLVINFSSSSIDTQVHCDSFLWVDGNIYTSSNNTATYLYQTIDGCDSLLTLDLIINNSDTSYTDITACDSLVWNGNTYTQSGTYSSSLSSSNNVYSLDFGFNDAVNIQPVFSGVQNNFSIGAWVHPENFNGWGSIFLSRSNDHYLNIESATYSPNSGTVQVRFGLNISGSQ